MNATRFLGTLLIALTVTATLRAQTANAPKEIRGPLPPPPAAFAPDPAPAATPTHILTAPPDGQYPPGTYASPWCGPHGCTGPLGKHGPLTYEIYSTTGVSMVVGNGVLASNLKTGVIAGGGARSLWFRADQTAAWVFDLGLTYTQNEGQQDKSLFVGTPRTSPVVVDPIFGQTTGGERIFPDGLVEYRVRKMRRTNFNFAFGRDWFWRGPGSLQAEAGNNFRTGADIGGRWGTSTIDLVPITNPNNTYYKGGSTIHGIFIGMHMGWERPVGNWILFVGTRAEWSYTFNNNVDPQSGDLHDINLLLNVGARF